MPADQSSAPGSPSPEVPEPRLESAESAESTQGAFDRAILRIAQSGGSSADGGPERLPPTVLLTGESGVGKSRAARQIHDLSPRAGGPFITAHLAGLSPSLIEAELFGHVEGAFTGASRARKGRFQRASGGTIVLEAIETLEFSLQVKLLRVLQERVVEPLGAEAPEPVDVRVIATTAKDLRVAVDEGSFREDLYYRLAVVPLAVPPLRVRAGGPAFGELCGDLAQAVAARVGVPVRELSPEAVAMLAAHPWPGNFRELENALERVHVLGAGRSGGELSTDGVGGGPTVDPAVDPVSAAEFDFLGEPLQGAADEIATAALAAGVGLEDLDRAMIEAALREERGNASAASRRIGLSRRAFDYRRRKLEP